MKVRFRVLDTNRLIAIWHGRVPLNKRRANSARIQSEANAKTAARCWLEQYPESAILTPIQLEFIAGVVSRDELVWARAFLSEFVNLDEGTILVEDWQEALRLAARVPYNPRPRGALDSLILAICKRLNVDLDSMDGGLPHRHA